LLPSFLFFSFSLKTRQIALFNQIFEKKEKEGKMKMKEIRRQKAKKEGFSFK
jgi:hypothetical protein